MLVSGHVPMNAEACRGQRHQSPEAGVTGSCEVLDMGLGLHLGAL